MKRFLHGLGFSIAALAFSPLASARAPTADVREQVLQQSLLKLRPVGISERNVLFQDVRAGTPHDTRYPFQVTLLIRDYEPGYPANRYYGNTCVGRMDKSQFDLSRDDFGDSRAADRPRTDRPRHDRHLRSDGRGPARSRA